MVRIMLPQHLQVAIALWVLGIAFVVVNLVALGVIMISGAACLTYAGWVRR